MSSRLSVNSRRSHPRPRCSPPGPRCFNPWWPTASSSFHHRSRWSSHRLLPAPIRCLPPPLCAPPARNGRQIPPDADPQGFVGYPGARCNDTNPPVAIGRTADSVVVICQTGVGRFYYKGVGLQNGLSVEIDDPVQTGATFVATNNGVQYLLSPTALIITQGSTVLSNEPMLEYWSA
jgi:hypothetical protein